MNRFFALCCTLTIAQPAIAQSAVEKAEMRIAELVAPGSNSTTTASQPILWQPARAMEEFAVPLKPATPAPVRLQQAPVHGIKPRSAPEGELLAGFQDKTPPPKQVELPTKPL